MKTTTRKPRLPKTPAWVRVHGVTLPGYVRLCVPIDVRSEANQREHWTVKHKRKTLQQQMWRATVHGKKWTDATSPLVIEMTRLYAGRQRAFDTDNLAGAFKHLRDAIAKWIGRDDGAASVTWRVEQEAGDVVGVRVVIETQTAGAKC